MSTLYGDVSVVTLSLANLKEKMLVGHISTRSEKYF